MVADQGGTQMHAPSKHEAAADQSGLIAPDTSGMNFYRADPARHNTSASPASTGLGLAIVRTIMELHGGRAHARVPGTGRPGPGTSAFRLLTSR